MKTLWILLLVASLTANALWLGGKFSRSATPAPLPGKTPIVARPAEKNDLTTDADVADLVRSESSRPLVALLRSGAPEQLRDALRAMGFEEESIRLFVALRLWNPVQTRLRELEKNPDTDVWWRDASADDPRAIANREERRRLSKEVEEKLRALFPENPNLLNAWGRRSYGFLPDAKQEALTQIQRDYAELMDKIRLQTNGVLFDSDKTQLRYLEQENRRDIEALLTPAELREYDLRNSSTSGDLRWKMTRMDASEEEFLAIYNLQRDFDERMGNTSPYSEKAPRDNAYQEAEKTLKEQIHSALGDARYREYVLASDGGYQQLKSVVQRLGLPAATPDQLYALRDTVPAAAQAIANDDSLTPQEKKTQVAALAATTRRQIENTLGAEAAGMVLRGGAFHWIARLQDGVITTFDQNGDPTHTRLPQK